MLGIGNYLWRLIPANPILLRVVEAGGRRRRDLLIRCAYLGALIVLVILLLVGSAGSFGANAKLAELNKTSANLFFWMSYVQLFLVALLAPIFTAGAITQENDSNTYDILLATPLTNGQILLGSLFSRLFFIVALLVSGIPIFAITQIFGGVAIRSIVLSFLIACATAFATGAMAIAMSVFRMRTRRSIFGFYLFIVLFLGIPLLIEQMGYLQYRWEFDTAGKPITHISLLAGVHPFLALRVIFGDPAYRPPDGALVNHYGWPWNWYLSSPHTFYIALMFTLSLVLVMPSVLLLRRIAQSNLSVERFAGSIVVKALSCLPRVRPALRLLGLRQWADDNLRLVSGERRRTPRRVWSNPIAWREARTRASANRAIIQRYGFMVAGIVAAVVLLVLSGKREVPAWRIGAQGYDSAEDLITIVQNDKATLCKISPDRCNLQLEGNRAGREVLRPGMQVLAMNKTQDGTITMLNVGAPPAVLSDKSTRQFLLGLMLVELSIILLILTQAAASTATREKEDGTLDLMLSTPITSRYYIWGKLRGLVSFVLPLVAVPIASILLFIIRDAFSSETPGQARWIVFPEALFLLPATLVMLTAFAAILGMQMSLRCRKTVMAVMSSVGIVGAVCGGLAFCGKWTAGANNLDKLGLIIGSFSPFTLMSLLVNPAEIAGGLYGLVPADYTDGRAMVFVAGWAAVGAYGMVVWGMYKSMVHNFDMTIRRQAT